MVAGADAEKGNKLGVIRDLSSLKGSVQLPRHQVITKEFVAQAIRLINSEVKLLSM